MSTIAYKDGIIACDERSANGSEFQTGVLKIGRTRHYLFGYAGKLGTMFSLFDWIHEIEVDAEGRRVDPTYFYQAADKSFADGDDGTALIANREGDVFSVSGDGCVTVHPRGFEGIGSGGTYAVGAMMTGASADEAVEIAKMCDVYTGGRVHMLGWRTDDVIRPRALIYDPLRK